MSVENVPGDSHSLVTVAITHSSFAAFASREMLLPDIGMVHGRTIVTVWDYGLEKVEDNAVRLIMKAVEVVQTFSASVVTTQRKVEEKMF